MAQPFPDVDDLSLDFESEDDDVLNPIRGILVAMALCVPFWAVVYLIYRSIA